MNPYSSYQQAPYPNQPPFHPPYYPSNFSHNNQTNQQDFYQSPYYQPPQYQQPHTYYPQYPPPYQYNQQYMQPPYPYPPQQYGPPQQQQQKRSSSQHHSRQSQQQNNPPYPQSNLQTFRKNSKKMSIDIDVVNNEDQQNQRNYDRQVTFGHIGSKSNHPTFEQKEQQNPQFNDQPTEQFQENCRLSNIQDIKQDPNQPMPQIPEQESFIQKNNLNQFIQSPKHEVESEESSDESLDNIESLKKKYNYNKKYDILYDQTYKYFIPCQGYENLQFLKKQKNHATYKDHQNVIKTVVNKDSRKVDEKKTILEHKRQNAYLKKLEDEAVHFVMKLRLYSDNPKKVFNPPNIQQSFGQRQTIDRLASTCRRIIQRTTDECKGREMYGAANKHYDTKRMVAQETEQG